MKPAGMLLLTLVLVVAALAVYHFAFRGESAGPGLDGAAQRERESLDRELARVEKLFGTEYDEGAMRAIVDRSGITLTPEQAAQVLPLLHAHLVELRGNLEDARTAVLAGKPPGERVRFHARAAQAHSRLLGKLRNIIPPTDATALFRAYPSMFPPPLGDAAAGKTRPSVDPRTGMPAPAAGAEGGSK